MNKTRTSQTLRRSLLAAGVLAACGLGAATEANATAALAAYNANPALVSVSGLSSGGFMSAQLGVAYSGTFKLGFGVFAGGPDDCARAQSYTSCMYNMTPSITGPDANIASWSGTANEDALSNLASRRIYLWTGSADTTVGPNVVNQLKSQLSSYYTASNFTLVTTSGAIHTFPTDFSGSGDNSCTSSSSPYISNCSYDGAGAVLQWMYGSTTLNARNNGTLGGTVVAFDQTKFIASGNGMDSTGYVYVPANCASGSTVCSVHVAVHGCLQSYSAIGADYVNNTGYNKWADTNNIIVLYPQAIADNTSHSTPGNGSVSNGNGCWDWIGWYGSNFDEKGGIQMTAIVAMVNKITSGYTGGTTTTTAATTTTTAGGTTTTTAATTTTTHATTTTTTATTTTTTAGGYTQTSSATVTNHYIAGRINVTQYNTLGVEYGYNTTITLYYCPSLSGWTNHSNCAPLS